MRRFVAAAVITVVSALGLTAAGSSRNRPVGTVELAAAAEAERGSVSREYKAAPSEELSDAEKEIMAAVDPLDGDTPRDLFEYTISSLAIYEAEKRGVRTVALPSDGPGELFGGTYGPVVGIYENGEHKFYVGAAAEEVLDVEELEAYLSAVLGPRDIWVTADHAPVRRAGYILYQAANDFPGPGFIYYGFQADDALPLWHANEALLRDGFPLPADFRERFRPDLLESAAAFHLLTPVKK